MAEVPTFQFPSSARVFVMPWECRRCWTRWSLRRNDRRVPCSLSHALGECPSRCSWDGSASLQNAQRRLEFVSREEALVVPVVVAPNGAQCHASNVTWRDFSCLAQSYLLLNRSQQNVQQYRRCALLDFCFLRLVGLPIRNLSAPGPASWAPADELECADFCESCDVA
ncbi:hypothetical protein BDV19DRAFT_355206 [Aspergillus venezuelensis]